MSKPEDFSFCESVHATARSCWHVRRLTDSGAKYGGGIDSASLCGRIEDGWDLQVEINQFHINNVTCLSCRDDLLRKISLDSLPVRNDPRSKRH